MAWTNEARLKAVETKRLNGIYNQFDRAKAEGRELKSSLIGRPGKSIPHTDEAKAKISEKALASKLRRAKC